MSLRTLLILSSTVLGLSLAASPFPGAREAVFRTALPAVDIKSAEPYSVVDELAQLYHAADKLDYGVAFVLVDDPHWKPGKFSFSEKKVSLSDLLYTFCEQYGWSYLYTEHAVVMGTKDGLDRFTSVYGKKRWPLEKNVIIPRILLGSATIKETAEFLTRKARDLDTDAKWDIRGAGDTAMTATLSARNISLGDVVQLFAAAVGREPEQALPTTRIVSAGEQDGPEIASPAIAEVTELKCTYWRAFHEGIEIDIHRQVDGRLSLSSQIWPFEGKPTSNKGVANKVIGPEQLAPVLEFVNSPAMRNAFASEGLDDRLDGSLIQLTVEQRSFGMRFTNQDVFSPRPAMRDVRMRHAIEALFKLAGLEFKDKELY